MIPQLEIITDEVCRYYGIKPYAIQTKNRKTALVKVRQVCHYMARKHTKYSLSVIGSNIGGKDHATVMYGDCQVKNDIKYYTEIAKEIDTLNDIIDSKLKNKAEYITPKIKEYIRIFMEDDLSLDFGNVKLHFSKNYIRL